MAYTADIQIAVRGAREIDQAIKSLNRLNNSINVVNRNAKLLEGKNFNVASIENYSRAVSKAERAVRKAAEGTELERRAVSQLVSAMELENKARQRKNFLIAQEVANRRRVQATIDAGFGVQGPQAAPVRAGRGPTSPIGGAAFIPGSPAARRAATRGTVSAPVASNDGRIGGVVSNAVIGGAFPLLFGQTGGAATGGAIGGAVGSLFGGTGGFAGSLLGTLIGDIASQGAKIKQLGEDIGFSAEQTKILEGAFSRAGREAEKFEAAVQNIRGLGLSLEDQADAINLAARLTEQYGGRVDKVAAAYADFVEKGKVGIADINKFTAQGVPILDALEKKFGTNRDGVLALAKDGKISAQELSDALVQISRASDTTNKKVKAGWDKVWDDLSKGASMSVRGVVAVFSSLVGSSTSTTGDIASLFSGLYRRMIEGALDAGARISRILAATARAAANYAAFYELGGLNIFATGAKGAAKGAESIFTNLDKQLQGIRNTPAAEVGNIAVPGQAPPSTGRVKGKSDAERAAEAAEKERQRVAQVVRERIAESEFLQLNTRLQDDILAAEMMKDSMLAARLKGEERLLAIQYNYAKQLSTEKNIEAQRAIIYEGSAAIAEAQSQTQRELAKIQLEEDQRRLDSLQQYIEKQYELNTAIQQQLDLAESVSTTLGQGLTGAFNLLVQGSENWGASLRDIASNILVDLANQLLRIFVIEQAINAIKTFLTPFTAATPLGAGGGKVKGIGTLGPNYGIPQYADGGYIKANQLSIIGERGPELFIPGRSGTIVPNERLGSSTNVVVNVDAKGSSVQGDDTRASQLGRVVSAAVQAEIVKQQRPGGLLAGTR